MSRGDPTLTEIGDFWSRRRARVAAEEAAEARAEETAVRAEEQARQEKKTDEELLAELNLKAPEDMAPGDDFSAFMSQAVPDRLRRRALRVLWRSNPVLANLDSLVDYGEDFTDGATVVENLQTAYQVGKGMLKHVEHLAAQAEVAKKPDEVPEEPDVSGQDDVDVVSYDALPAAEAPDQITCIEPVSDQSLTSAEPADVMSYPRRRMRFSYSDEPEGTNSQS